MADEKNSEKVVPVIDGPDHGYIGTVRDDTPNEDYSVTGVVKAAEAARQRDAGALEEKPAAKPAARKTTAPKS